jgi:hypothetical protein
VPHLDNLKVRSRLHTGTSLRYLAQILPFQHAELVEQLRNILRLEVSIKILKFWSDPCVAFTVQYVCDDFKLDVILFVNMVA